VGPPLLAVPVAIDCLSKELVAIALQSLDSDATALHWPEATAARLVLEIDRLVGCTDEHTLARLNDLFATIGRPIALDGPCNECLQRGILGAAHGAHL